VSPPTALSSVAAAAITGGDAFKTMLLTLRITLPAFLVPFAFVLSPHGEGCCSRAGSWHRLDPGRLGVAVAAWPWPTGGWLLGRPAAERVLAGWPRCSCSTWSR
jgi:hypothetical protein